MVMFNSNVTNDQRVTIHWINCPSFMGKIIGFQSVLKPSWVWKNFHERFPHFQLRSSGRKKSWAAASWSRNSSNPFSGMNRMNSEKIYRKILVCFSMFCIFSWCVFCKFSTNPVIWKGGRKSATEYSDWLSVKGLESKPHRIITASEKRLFSPWIFSNRFLRILVMVKYQRFSWIIQWINDWIYPNGD